MIPIIDQLKEEDKERLLYHMEELKKWQATQKPYKDLTINAQKEAEDDELTI